MLFEPGSSVPCVGASGVISGVIGAYVLLFPRHRFLVRWFWFLWMHVKFVWPAYVYFGLWFVLQLPDASRWAKYVCAPPQ
jgi:membrane associated rhomboid family serine protease